MAIIDVPYVFYENGYLQGMSAMIPESEFAFYERKSRAILNSVIAGKEIGVHSDKVKCCICNIAEVIYSESRAKAAQTSGVSSEKIGDYSVTYISTADIEKNLKNEIRSAVIAWLGDTDLIYLGV